MKHGPNVITVQVVTAADRSYIVGCYTPPKDRIIWGRVEEVWEKFPKGCQPMLLWNLNVDLHSIPVDKLGEVIAEEIDAMDVQ